MTKKLGNKRRQKDDGITMSDLTPDDRDDKRRTRCLHTPNDAFNYRWQNCLYDDVGRLEIAAWNSTYCLFKYVFINFT